MTSQHDARDARAFTPRWPPICAPDRLDAGAGA
jgi:hypothetical protein